MVLTEQQLKELNEAAKPLVKFLCDNFDPHCRVTVTPTDAAISFDSATVSITEFLKD